MHGYVSAIDVYFQRTHLPYKQEVSNVEAYYSGHFEDYGMNCQACVLRNLSFLYFGVIAPGSTDDNVPYPLAIRLKKAVDSLPPGLYCVADAAYMLAK